MFRDGFLIVFWNFKRMVEYGYLCVFSGPVKVENRHWLIMDNIVGVDVDHDKADRESKGKQNRGHRV